jgi:hypothetical protein
MNVIEKIESSVKERGRDLIVVARNHYGNMARSWWQFAKTVALIKESRSYEVDGHESFKEWCLKEYPTINEKTLLKLSLIVEEWYEPIENRLEHDEAFKLPAYESCYRIVSAKDRLPAAEVSRLKKELLDEKLSFHTLVEKIKTKAKPKDNDFSRVHPDVLEKALVADLSEDELDTGYDTGVDSDIEDADDIFEMSSTPKKSLDLLARLQANVDYLNDNLLALLDSDDLSQAEDQVVKLAESLNTTLDLSEKLFTKLEEI